MANLQPCFQLGLSHFTCWSRGTLSQHASLWPYAQFTLCTDSRRNASCSSESLYYENYIFLILNSSSRTIRSSLLCCGQSRFYRYDIRTHLSVKNKKQPDATYYFIVLLIGSTCFEHYYAHHQELTTVMLITTLVVSFLVCCIILLCFL